MMKFKNKISKQFMSESICAGKKSLSGKKWESFSKSLEIFNKKNSLVYPCTISKFVLYSVIPLYDNSNFIHHLMNI